MNDMVSIHEFNTKLILAHRPVAVPITRLRVESTFVDEWIGKLPGGISWGYLDRCREDLGEPLRLGDSGSCCERS